MGAHIAIFTRVVDRLPAMDANARYGPTTNLSLRIDGEISILILVLQAASQRNAFVRRSAQIRI
jgi:hypothetical protein